MTIEFWADEFENATKESKKAQTKCSKVEQALVEATKASETLLQSVEDSWKSFEDIEIKLKEANSQEDVLKTKLTTAEASSKSLQLQIEPLN